MTDLEMFLHEMGLDKVHEKATTMIHAMTMERYLSDD